MGVSNGTLKAEMTSQRHHQKCLPGHPYSSFPEGFSSCGSTTGLSLQSRCIDCRDIGEDVYWWMDAQFLPYNDCQLLVTSSAFTLRPNGTWESVNRVPRGRILLLDLRSRPIRVRSLKGSKCLGFPKVQLHPLGHVVAYAAVGEVILESFASQSDHRRRQQQLMNNNRGRADSQLERSIRRTQRLNNPPGSNNTIINNSEILDENPTTANNSWNADDGIQAQSNRVDLATEHSLHRGNNNNNNAQDGTVRADPQPGCQTPPFCTLDGAAVLLDPLPSEPVYVLSRDADNRNQRFCALSPNGAYLAVLSQGRGNLFLELYCMQSSLVSCHKPVQIPCHRLCPGFQPARNDHVECSWSPDSAHIAVASSSGLMFVVDRKTASDVIIICPDMLESRLSTAASFDFDPRSPFQVMSVGCEDGTLRTVSVDADHAVRMKRDLQDAIDCVRYSVDGVTLAASLRSFAVSVFSSSHLSLVHSIDMAPLCPRHATLFGEGTHPTVNRLSFSHDGRFLATSCCDGVLRVWPIPRVLTLQEWCRWRVLKHAPVAAIRTLDLPEKIKNFILME